MDHRNTEDFARHMEAAALRARMLREQALDELFAAIGRGVRNLARRIAQRRVPLLPEA